MAFADYKNFLVFGMARSGRSVSLLLAERGRRVSVSDDSAATLESLMSDDEFRARGIETVPSAQAQSVIESCDCLVLSPGVPIDHPLVTRARARGVAVIGEIEAAFHFTNARLVGVTGTNGKSTVVGVIGELLTAGGVDVVVAGNVGMPFSQVLREGDHDTLVLELSSFQLDTLDEFRLDVAVLLNVTPDHLDRYHNSFEEYAASKERILNRSEDKTFFVYNADDETTVAIADRYRGPKAAFSVSRVVDAGTSLSGGKIRCTWGGRTADVIDRSEFSPVGVHNAENALASVAAVIPFDLDVAEMRTALRRYRPLPHRMELVRVVGGVAYINDSKATNVDAAVKSLASIEGGVLPILGGRDKEGDFAPLLDFAERIRTAILVGEAAEKIRGVIDSRCPVVMAGDMCDAVKTAAQLSQPGDTVLLAPACASFDMFDSYQHRGEVFRECVNKLEEAR